jgi:hypothetical protein
MTGAATAGAKKLVRTTGRYVVYGIITARWTYDVVGCITVVGHPVQGSVAVTGRIATTGVVVISGR